MWSIGTQNEELLLWSSFFEILSRVESCTVKIKLATLHAESTQNPKVAHIGEISPILCLQKWGWHTPVTSVPRISSRVTVFQALNLPSRFDGWCFSVYPSPHSNWPLCSLCHQCPPNAPTVLTHQTDILILGFFSEQQGETSIANACAKGLTSLVTIFRMTQMISKKVSLETILAFGRLSQRKSKVWQYY